MAQSEDTFNDPQVLAVLNEIKDLLETSVAKESPATPAGMHFIDGTPRGVMHNILTSFLVFGCDTAGDITLMIGTRAYILPVPADDIHVIPFTMKINGGTDISISAAVGNLSTCYFVYQPE